VRRGVDGLRRGWGRGAHPVGWGFSGAGATAASPAAGAAAGSSTLIFSSAALASSAMVVARVGSGGCTQHPPAGAHQLKPADRPPPTAARGAEKMTIAPPTPPPPTPPTRRQLLLTPPLHGSRLAFTELPTHTPLEEKRRGEEAVTASWLRSRSLPPPPPRLRLPWQGGSPERLERTTDEPARLTFSVDAHTHARTRFVVEFSRPPCEHVPLAGIPIYFNNNILLWGPWCAGIECYANSAAGFRAILKAGGVLRTSSRPMLNLLLLLRASV